MKIAFFERDDTACSYYRQTLPLKFWKRNDKKIEVASYGRGSTHTEIESLLQQSNILIIPRAVEKEIIDLIDLRHEIGQKTVLDYDDNFFCVSPFSNHYQHFGTENVRVSLPDGSVMDLWKDGDSINIKENQEKLDNVKRIIEKADLITVTTDIIGNVFREYNKNVIAIPNCIDATLWQHKKIVREDDCVRMYWSGGSSHFDDWMMIAPALKNIMKDFPKVKLVTMGQQFKGTVKDLPQERLEHHEWVPVDAYPYKTVLMQPDFSIIPLQENKFSICKSTIKWIEQSALAVPSVTSHIPPYTSVFEEGNGIYIKDNNIDLWYEGMRMMIEDPILRASMGGKARDLVLDKYDINTQWVQWKRALEEILK